MEATIIKMKNKVSHSLHVAYKLFLTLKEKVEGYAETVDDILIVTSHGYFILRKTKSKNK
jgi:hypothetical protein